jgi:hypothetical protein
MAMHPRAHFIAFLLAMALTLLSSASSLRAQPPQPLSAPPDSIPAPTLDFEAARRRLPLYMHAVTLTLDPRLQRALAKIRSTERRYLAVRGYVRREHKVHTSWSWTASEAAAFRRTAEYRAMLDTIAAIKRRFAARNPGFRLSVITDIRTLDVQLRKWNTVASIAVSGREVVDTALVVLADSTWPDVPDSASTQRFRAFLDGYELVNTPTVAVPGFSDHGQLKAFDFKVYRGGRMVAGTTTATIPQHWDAPGWSCRLNEVICDYGDAFLGPLQEPYEPWHYTWRGTAPAAQGTAR